MTTDNSIEFQEALKSKLKYSFKKVNRTCIERGLINDRLECRGPFLSKPVSRTGCSHGLASDRWFVSLCGCSDLMTWHGRIINYVCHSASSINAVHPFSPKSIKPHFSSLIEKQTMPRWEATAVEWAHKAPCSGCSTKESHNLSGQRLENAQQKKYFAPQTVFCL